MFVRALKELEIIGISSSFKARFGMRSTVVVNAQACRQRTQNTTQFLKSNHTNLPCLRQSRRRQTSLALKAHCAFNSEQARRSELLSCAQCCAQACRRAHVWNTEHINKNPAERIQQGFVFRKSELLISIISEQL